MLEQHIKYAAVDDRIAGHDLRCVTQDSGEVFPSVDCCLSYCEANAADGRKPRQRVSKEQQHAHSHVNHLSAASYPACPSDGRRVTMRAASMHSGGACAREACVPGMRSR